MPDSPKSKRKVSSRRRSPEEIRGRLKPHDPFELIRWLAYSQPDPRKALAELVQNSLDAGATRIRVVRYRERGVACLRIVDDGEGVIPEMSRKDALRYVATHIGHSRKRHLSPSERLELMTQGQYGIGLLGFWALGEMLEMRTAVPGERPARLILYRDKPTYRIEPMPGRLPLGDRWTEVVVVGVHRQALPVLIGRRAADYLSSELRGQLLAREVDLVIEDRISRGRAQKIVPVRPPRFLGEPIKGIGPVEIDGYAPVRFELYLHPDPDENDRAHPVAVYSAGTLVATSFAELAPLGLDRAPWTDPHLSGLVDFPGFRVAPGARRGVVADRAAEAFARAVASVEPALLEILEQSEQRRAEEFDRTLIRDLQRAFRDFYRRRPIYSLLPVREREGAGPDHAGGEGAVPADPDATEPPEGAVAEPGLSSPSAPVGHLFPPGPPASLRIRPDPVRLARNTICRVRAVVLDESGRPVEGRLEFAWRLEGIDGEIRIEKEDAPDRALLVAGDRLGEGTLTATAVRGETEVSGSVAVAVVDRLPGRGGDEGIPEPRMVEEPGAAWRSRMVDDVWQVNTAHPDYRAIADRPALKLRYLALLFAKEVVVRSTQDPRLAVPMEQLIEIAAYADRNLSFRGRKRRREAARGE